MTKITATAHTNIALIKYWGKLPGHDNISATDSLSLTLDQFFTTTSVEFTDSQSDTFLLDDKPQELEPLRRVVEHIDLFRRSFDRHERVFVRSTNTVLTSSGLASSASGFAALTIALAKLFDCSLDRRDLSRIARRGSGSAARSLFGGFSFLHGGIGTTDMMAYAEPVPSELLKDICMLVLECSSEKKPISSRDAMLLTERTSIFYQSYLDNHPKLLGHALDALRTNDLEKLGDCMEQSTMQMHATMLGCTTPFCYFNATTMHAIQKILELRKQGLSCYFTMDAGPHVKILCKNIDTDKVYDALIKANLGKITRCAAGPGAFLHE